ncbi:zinc-binding dehydrogenase [Pseudomonas sp. HK3]|jgi:NADPH:quinone reductase-like Zn-dependent oxidoreductase
MNSVPTKMHALQIDTYSEKLSFKYIEKDIPKLGDNEVLIRILKAPVNPSDLAFVTGNYGFKKALPVVPGMEGCGEVIAAGAHSDAQSLLGCNVACIAGEGDGTWAEYMVASPYQCIPFSDSVSLEKGSMLMVNPMTALALISIAKQGGHSTIIQNAASSALSNMIRFLAKQEGLQVINIVRSRQQAKAMTKAGIANTLNSSAKDYHQSLKAACEELNASLLLDAVGGEATADILDAMPEASTAVIYGGLSGEPPKITIEHVIFKNHKIQGFWLAHYLKDTPVKELQSLGKQAQVLMAQDFEIQIQSQPKLEYASHSIATYAGNMSRGKVLISPHQD